MKSLLVDSCTLYKKIENTRDGARYSDGAILERVRICDVNKIVMTGVGIENKSTIKLYYMPGVSIGGLPCTGDKIVFNDINYTVESVAAIKTTRLHHYEAVLI